MSVSQIATTDSSLPEIVEQGDNANLDKLAFLKLLTVQLQNQDPLNPMDSDNMAQQQAIFAQVEQLINLNESIDEFMQSQQDVLVGIAGVFNTLESASFLGRNVSFFTDDVYIDESGAVQELYYDLTHDALVSFTVRNENGLVVKSTETRVVNPGNRIPVGWDGTDSAGNLVPPGRYQITLNVQNTSGVPLQGQTYGEVMVRAVDFRNGTPTLTLLDGRMISAADILALSENIEE